MPKERIVYKFDLSGKNKGYYPSIKAAAADLEVTATSVQVALMKNRDNPFSRTTKNLVLSYDPDYIVSLKPKKERSKGSEIRICPICGKEYRCFPSDKTKTCGNNKCRQQLRTAKRKADGTTKWGLEARKRLAEKGETENLKKGTAAAMQSPNSGRFETNINAKYWKIMSPDGKMYEFNNLLLWCRENTYQFGREQTDHDARVIASGFRNIKRSKLGKRRDKVLSYKGWQLLEWKEERINLEKNLSLKGRR